MAYPNEIFTTFAFCGFLMCMIPLPLHLKTWNTGTCLYMFWTGIGCLMLFINSIIWHGNTVNWAPVWCDICTKFMSGASFGIPACFLCINRRLYHLQRPNRTAIITKSDKLLVDLSICLGVPVIGMTFGYINQGHRFNILEDIGCYPHIYPTWVAILLLRIPIIIIGLVSASYCIRTIIFINRRRSKFNALLAGQLNMSSGLYFRLMYLASIEVLCTIPLVTVFVICDVKVFHLKPWLSWEDTHWGISRVDQYPALIWRSYGVASSLLDLTRWLFVLYAFVFFSFFGFAEDVMLHYRSAILSVAKFIGISRDTSLHPIAFISAPEARKLDGTVFATKDNRIHRTSIATFPSSVVDIRGTSMDEEKQGVLDVTLNGTMSETGWSSTMYDSLGSPTLVSLPPPVLTRERRSSHSDIDRSPVRHSSTVLSTNNNGPTTDQDIQSRPSIGSRLTQNLRSFLHFDFNEPSLRHVSAVPSSGFNTSDSIVEEGTINRRPTINHLSRHFRSFLNLD